MSEPEERGVSAELLGKTAVAAAQLNAMERGGRGLPHGCRLFWVEQGWESKALKDDAGTAIAETLLELEEALRQTEKKVIFIPLGALMTEGDIEKICQRNAALKTLFKEVGKHE